MKRRQRIISYTDMVQREHIALQKGMNFRVRGGTVGYSIILMSVRSNAPYQDKWHGSEGPHANMLEYEGHDAPRLRTSSDDPRYLDQPMTLISGKPTENGKFYEAAIAAKSGQREAEVVQVYEKIASGIWNDCGRFHLVDAVIKQVNVKTGSSQSRKVFRFFLRAAPSLNTVTSETERELAISRQIPTPVKVAVWRRDQGKCVTCGATNNLHFDHDVPFSKGGSSITVANVKLLCARHNLGKSDKIISLGPIIVAMISSFFHFTS